MNRNTFTLNKKKGKKEIILHSQDCDRAEILLELNIREPGNTHFLYQTGYCENCARQVAYTPAREGVCK
jgi:hypothetical protein